MASGAMETLLDHVCQLASLPTRNETSSELLHRFVTYQDELAFNTLVQKYGRLVISVARQILCHEQDAEDAFQATFLILSRRAESIRNAESIASWLYGVA